MISRILERLERYKKLRSDNTPYGIGVLNGYAEAIEIVKEESKNGGWIPVEQKTPEDFTNVYATCISLVDDREPWVIEGIYHSVTGWEEMTPYLSWGKAKVIAWMPKELPEPYQKGDK